MARAAGLGGEHPAPRLRGEALALDEAALEDGGELEDRQGHRIYQLTSRAVTYNLSLPQSLVLRLGAADDGETEEGYRFERLALYARSCYALISVDPGGGETWFKLYGKQELESPDTLVVTDGRCPAARRAASRTGRMRGDPQPKAEGAGGW